MDKVELTRLVMLDNPLADNVDIVIAVAAISLYLEAKANVDANGAICAHPRTGVPFENPYLRVMSSQAAVLQRLKHLSLNSVFIA